MATWWKRMVTVVATLALTTQLGGSAAALAVAAGLTKGSGAPVVTATAGASREPMPRATTPSRAERGCFTSVTFRWG